MRSNSGVEDPNTNFQNGISCSRFRIEFSPGPCKEHLKRKRSQQKARGAWKMWFRNIDFLRPFAIYPNIHFIQRPESSQFFMIRRTVIRQRFWRVAELNAVGEKYINSRIQWHLWLSYVPKKEYIEILGKFCPRFCMIPKLLTCISTAIRIFVVKHCARIEIIVSFKVMKIFNRKCVACESPSCHGFKQARFHLRFGLVLSLWLFVMTIDISGLYSVLDSVYVAIRSYVLLFIVFEPK